VLLKPVVESRQGGYPLHKLLPTTLLGRTYRPLLPVMYSRPAGRQNSLFVASRSVGAFGRPRSRIVLAIHRPFGKLSPSGPAVGELKLGAPARTASKSSWRMCFGPWIGGGFRS
jgi:hypothetical protein